MPYIPIACHASAAAITLPSTSPMDADDDADP
jgi:hypothetical protein